MKFGIIAAGEGSRLNEEGLKTPKPLVLINGERMIDRLIRIFRENGATEVVVIINKLTDLVQKHLEGTSYGIPIRVVAQTTSSSMHSFYLIAPYLDGERFCLTTVDTIFSEGEFSKYIRTFAQFHGDGLMAVTDYIDDEKPLYVETDKDLNILDFKDEKNAESVFVSGGIYCLSQTTLKTLDYCIEHNKSRMRNFQRQLIIDGLSIKAYPFEKIIDVDHIADIQKAENFLKIV